MREEPEQAWKKSYRNKVDKKIHEEQKDKRRVIRLNFLFDCFTSYPLKNTLTKETTTQLK